VRSEEAAAVVGTAHLRGGPYGGHTIDLTRPRPIICVTVEDGVAHVLETAPEWVLRRTRGRWRIYRLVVTERTTTPVYVPLSANPANGCRPARPAG
jgi:hypothetical protein